jgi:SAM-dependent methyltransferase
VNAEFDRLASNYDELLKDPLRDVFAPGSQFFVTRKLDILRAFAARRGLDTHRSRWLDVGCGRGDLLRAGRAHFGEAIGCDVSAGMLDDCRDLNVVQQPDPRRLPFEDASIDWVTAVCIYHHVPRRDRAAVTAEVRRVLRPGGVFAIVEHNPFNPAVQVIVRRTPVDEHADLVTARRTRRLMKSAGIRPVETRYFLCIPQRFYPALGAVERAVERLPLGGQFAVFGINTPIGRIRPV